MKKVLIKIEEGLTLKIKFPNGETIEYRYIIESELLKKIDRLIQLRIDQLKKAYEI